MNFKPLQGSPATFRSALLVDTDSGPRKLADVLDPWQAQDFAALDPAWRRVVGHDVTPTVQRAWLERPRGHSKTSDAAVMVSWALFSARPPKKINGVSIACDREQSQLLRNSIDTLCRLNPWLAAVLEVQQTKVVNRHTGSQLSIESADVASSFGWLVDFVCVDEITHAAKRDLFDSALSAIAKRRNGLLVSICNAGFRDSWQWELREKIRSDGDWYFHRLDGPAASWISTKILDEQQRLLPDKVYRRLWLNQWADGSGDALEVGDVAAALNLRNESPPERGWIYTLGADIGLVHDATVLALIGRNIGYSEPIMLPSPQMSRAMAAMADLDLLPAVSSPSVEYRRVPGTERLKLCRLEIWQPDGGKVDLTAVENRIIQLHKEFRLARVTADNWQAELMVQRLSQRGIPCEGLQMSGTTLQALATSVLTEFRGRTIDLIDEPLLAADLRNLRIASKSYGFRLESPSNALSGTPHGDTASALALAVRAARQTSVAFALADSRRLVLN